MSDANRTPPDGLSSALLPRVVSGLTVVGVAVAATIASIYAEDKGVGIAAWVAVAVIGASTMIAAGKPKASECDKE